MTAGATLPAAISICGVLVHVHPDKYRRAKQEMLKIEGLEIHACTDQGKQVVTIETDSYDDTGEKLSRLQLIEGVLSVSLIYQHSEDLQESPE